MTQDRDQWKALVNTVMKFWFHTTRETSRYSVVGIVTGYGLDDRGVGVRVLVASRIFSYPRRSDRLWSPPNLSKG
jgi:hypothetical protein